jgi:hypothetical protein
MNLKFLINNKENFIGINKKLQKLEDKIKDKIKEEKTFSRKVLDLVTTTLVVVFFISSLMVSYNISGLTMYSGNNSVYNIIKMMASFGVTFIMPIFIINGTIKKIKKNFLKNKSKAFKNILKEIFNTELYLYDFTNKILVEENISQLIKELSRKEIDYINNAKKEKTTIMYKNINSIDLKSNLNEKNKSLLIKEKDFLIHIVMKSDLIKESKKELFSKITNLTFEDFEEKEEKIIKESKKTFIKNI